MYIRMETYSLDWLCVIYIRMEFFFWDSPCGMYIPTEMIFSDYRVGCTYLRKWLGFDALLDHTRPQPRSQEGLSPTISGSCAKDTLSHTLTWRRFQMPSWKGVKNRLFRTDVHQCSVCMISFFLLKIRACKNSAFQSSATVCQQEMKWWFSKG